MLTLQHAGINSLHYVKHTDPNLKSPHPKEQSILQFHSHQLWINKSNPPFIIHHPPSNKNLTNSDISRTTAIISLSSNNHIIKRTKVHSKVIPSIKMISSSNSSLRTLILTNRPVLRKSGSTLNRRLIDSFTGVNVVNTSITGDGALLGCATGGVISSEVFDDVEFNQGVLGPAVDGEVAVSCMFVSIGHSYLRAKFFARCLTVGVVGALEGNLPIAISWLIFIY